MNPAAVSRVNAAPIAAWGAVWSMALCVAMLIASEFMPVSLLTPMAKGLSATNDGLIRIAGSKSSLFHTLTSARQGNPVPSFVPGWRTGWDSNPR